MKITLLLRTLAAAVCCVLLAALGAVAQPGSGGPTQTPAATAVPIDGGISLLLAAGGAYGLKRLRARRRRT